MGEREADAGVLTWPQGNGWLAERLAAPLGDRLHTGRVIHRIEPSRHGVTVDALDVASGRRERWQARQVVVALPVHVAARVVQPLPAALRERAASVSGPSAPPWGSGSAIIGGVSAYRVMVGGLPAQLVNIGEYW